MPSRLVIAASVALLAGLSLQGMDRHTVSWGPVAIGLAAMVLICAALNSGTRRPALERLGVISYGIYLFHYPVAMVLLELTDLSMWAIAAVQLAVAVPLAEMSYRVIESPFRRGSGHLIGPEGRRGEGEADLEGHVGRHRLPAPGRGMGEAVGGDRVEVAGRVAGQVGAVGVDQGKDE